MSKKMLHEASAAWKMLNGIFSIYKPADKSCKHVRSALVVNICRTLNELEVRPPSDYVAIEGTPEHLSVIVRPNYADHPLVVGPRYQLTDVRLSFATLLGRRSSGIVVFGINDGSKLALNFHNARPLRTFRIKGRLGFATDNMYIDGKIVEKAKYDHAKRQHLDRILSTFEASHQKQMFLQSGVDIQSQTAYDLAVKGLLRPSSKNVPLIYSFKTIEWEPPDFTIEIQSINEYEDYILQIVHDIGIRLRTLATCTGIQCIKQGCFTIEHSLQRRHWTTENIINAIKLHGDVMLANNFKIEHEPYLVKAENVETLSN